jgi:hypothetical protein
VSAVGIAGFPTVGSSADRIGTTKEVIGSDEVELMVEGTQVRARTVELIPESR